MWSLNPFPLSLFCCWVEGKAVKAIKISGEEQVVVIYPAENRLVDVLPLKFQGKEKEAQVNYWGEKKIKTFKISEENEQARKRNFQMPLAGKHGAEAEKSN